MGTHRLAELLEQRADRAQPYLEFIRRETMPVGLYVLPAGGVDEQQPHTEDEVYVVLAGRSRFTAGEETRNVVPGDTIFVAAGVEHRFHDIAEQLVQVVVFAPPEGSTALRNLAAPVAAGDLAHETTTLGPAPRAAGRAGPRRRRL